MKKLLLPVIIFLILCNKHTTKKTNPLETFKTAEILFKNKHYKKAIPLFNGFVMENPLSDSADKAQFLLAESYFNIKDYERAKQEYDFLTHQYPMSAYKETALIKAGISAYKKRPYHERDLKSMKSIKQRFKSFVISYPSSSLLTTANLYLHKIDSIYIAKKLKACELYFKARAYKAALTYANSILESFSDIDTNINARLLYIKGVSLIKTNKKYEGLKTLKLLENNPKYRKHILKLYKEI